jgi:hypothetical protein
MKADREGALLRFKDDLKLSTEQEEYFGRVLLDRDAEIASYHARIRASKVFSVRDHEERAREILTSSQLRLMVVLDPDQERRFRELYDRHLVSEGISFEITPEITVIR